jgi:ribosome biogenesis GTPase
MIEGLVTRSQSGFYNVQTDLAEFVCQVRGKLKQGPREGDVVAIGDRVLIEPIDDENAAIEEVLPRKSIFSRKAPIERGEYQQILIANPDQVVIVFACAEPEPRLGMLDRYLVIAEMQELPALIVVNKADLVQTGACKDRFAHYQEIGYRLLFTSAKAGIGLQEFESELSKKISLLTGPSGVGKSSLLNTIQPGLGLQVREISGITNKGKHTTVTREMIPLKEGGYVADTPGLKALALWDIEPEEVDGYFPEIAGFVELCQFSDCTHFHEPDCAVRRMVEKNHIHPQRYRSYLRIRFGDSILDEIG